MRLILALKTLNNTFNFLKMNRRVYASFCKPTQKVVAAAATSASLTVVCAWSRHPASRPVRRSSLLARVRYMTMLRAAAAAPGGTAGRGTEQVFLQLRSRLLLLLLLQKHLVEDMETVLPLRRCRAFLLALVSRGDGHAAGRSARLHRPPALVLAAFLRIGVLRLEHFLQQARVSGECVRACVHTRPHEFNV